jgi:hypothetical protein
VLTVDTKDDTQAAAAALAAAPAVASSLPLTGSSPPSHPYDTRGADGRTDPAKVSAAVAGKRAEREREKKETSGEAVRTGGSGVFCCCWR